MTKVERLTYAKDVAGWTADEEGNVYNKKKRKIGWFLKGYLVSKLSIKSKYYQISLHQFIFWFFHKWIPDEVDHINRIRNDNKISNLRAVNHQQNSFNRFVKGYTFNKKSNKFIAQIMVNGKKLFLGRFDSELDAINAYLAAKKIYHII